MFAEGALPSMNEAATTTRVLPVPEGLLGETILLKLQRKRNILFVEGLPADFRSNS
jgi:hypothetical protein